VSALVVLPPMFLLGMSFPIAARVVGTGQPDVGRRVGAVYAGNVFGGIVGAFVGGFILLPQLGVARSLLLLGAGSMTLAIVLAWAIPMRRTWWRPVAVGAGALAVLLGVVLAPDLYAGIFQKRFLGQQVVLIDEGLENMAAVTDFPDTGERKLYLNGQPQASTTPLVANFHQLLGHLGMLVHPRPRDALVIGLGGGATPGALAQHSGVDVDVVELSGAVTRAAPLFGAINGNVVDRPNVSLKLDDGRNFLLLTDKRYDVITADIIRPRHAGANNLYSVEYYELAKRALKDDGMMVQWFEQLSEQQYKLLLRSFVDVFPYVSLWANGAIAIGSKSPIAVDPAALAARFDDPAARASLAAIGLTRPEDVLGLYVGNRDDALVYLGPGPVISDDRPYVEYYRSLPAGDRLPDVSGFPRDPAAIVRR
jgi:spermidine synthase